MDVWTKLAALLAVLLLLAGSSAGYGALLKLNRARVRYLAGEGVPRARRLMEMLEESSSLELTLASANGLALAVAAAVVVLEVGNALGHLTPAGIVFEALGFLAVLLVQVVSRAAGSLHPDDTLFLLRLPLRALRLLLVPLTALFRSVIRLVVPMDRSVATGAASATDDELRMFVDAAEEEGALEEEEREMIHGIFEMGERTVREIMVPRVDVTAVEASEPLREVLEAIKAKGHSRIPIYEETIDNIVGIVYAKDLLRHMDGGSLEDASRTLGRPSYFIPESKKIDELLHEMQRDKVHMAIVVDEYGGTAGIVTIEDLLEEIVGDIQDEFDVEESAIEPLGEGEAIFDARVSIHDVSETLSVTLADGEYDTIGGLVYDRLGKIPLVGDRLDVDGLSITVLATVGKRIKKVKVQVQPAVAQEQS
ncbi:MAG: hemolysin family protein [Sphingomonadaceae bacterium]